MSVDEMLQALAAPQRQQILRLVRDEAHSAGEIAKHCGSSQQAVSHHLQVLKDAGLVSVERDGRRRLYVVDPDGFESVQSFLAELWPAGLTKLKDTIEGSAS